MNTTQVRLERRAAQRFDSQQPVSIKITGTTRAGCGFSQDLSARGMMLYTDFPLAQGDAAELTLVMPSEITLGENMRVRCRGRVVRVVPTGVGAKSAVAIHFEGYEYLPAVKTADRRASDYSHAAAQDTPLEEAMSMHTFDWHGSSHVGRH